MTYDTEVLIEQARDLLSRTQVDFEATLELANTLRQKECFSYARKLYARVRAQPQARWPEARWRELTQRHALVTYKDPDLPADEKFELAFAILGEAEHLPTTTDQETLGLAGAIFKRKWEVDGQRSNLERALGYYYRGYQQGISKDFGYTAINTASVLELLAMQEEEAVQQDRSISVSAALRHQQASQIRQQIINTLREEAEKVSQTKPPDAQNADSNYWLLATLAEACFGLQDYAAADKWLSAAKVLPNISLWMRQSSIWQMAAMARFHDKKAKRAELSVAEAAQVREKAEKDFADAKREARSQEAAAASQSLEQARHQLSHAERELEEAKKHAEQAAQELAKLTKQANEAKQVLRNFIEDETALEYCLVGKVGLALSGGGFRASLFHIGVLAKLAEMDVLRYVEVLSCVSGGSILGAYYYLELRHALQTMRDADLQQADYVAIVQRMAREFPRGVRDNLRIRLIGSLWSNLKMTFLPTYTRSMRLGELYEQRLYGRVADKEGQRKRFLNELFIQPCEAKPDFHPKRDNWQRKNKVPMLVLNATTLNTGHNWQFTASFMGEPPSAINTAVDANYRLRRMFYRNQAPSPHNHVRLGHAVAASSCVPGMLHPLLLDGLYDGKVVRLVDGGVYDNQGTASLLEQDCKVLLVSDASGQMGTLDDPPSGEFGVVMRSCDISQERVRHAQYRELAMRRRSGSIRGLMFVHLKKDLDVDLVDWHGCLDPDDDSTDARSLAQQRPVTSYGVHKELQKRIAAIRTDLDSFSESEAYALMASGYLMTEDDFLRNPGIIDGLSQERIRQRSQGWPFLEFEEPLKQFGRQKKLAALLDTASQRFFKAWQLLPGLKYLSYAIGAIGLALPLAWFQAWYTNTKHFEFDWLNNEVFRLSFNLGARMYNLHLTWKVIVGIVLAFIFGRVFGPKIMRLAGWRKTLRQTVIAAALSVLGWLLAWFHLLTIDRWYLKWGESRRLLEKDRQP